MRIHRPVITRHTVHCLCGVFCGASPDRWFDHAADVHVLYPGELVDMTPISETAAAWQQARNRARAAVQRLAEAFAPLRRVLTVDRDPRQLTRDRIAVLNRPVIPNPPTTIDRITDA